MRNLDYRMRNPELLGDFLSSGTMTDDKLLTDEPDEANLQVVWLDETDMLKGTRLSNFSFSKLTSWHITDISPLQNR